jgi:hypothetical protein
MAYFVKISANPLFVVRFPALCPFTLQPDPKRTWDLTGRTETGFLGLPILTPMIVYYRKAIIQIPASQSFVRRQSLLGLYAGLLLAVALTALFLDAVWLHWLDRYQNYWLVLPAASFGVYLWKIWLARRVVIRFVGKESVVLRFSSKEYAEAFAALNGLALERSVSKLQPLE